MSFDRGWPLRAPREGERGALERFRDWLIRGGARLAPLRVERHPGGERTVHAQGAIREGEAVVDVPRGLLLTREVVERSAVGRAIERAGPELDSTHSSFAAFLLEEREVAGSPWAPYLDVLPRSWRHMPIFYGAEDLVRLRGSNALARLHRQARSFTGDYGLLCRAVPQLARHGVRRFAEARLAVLTRVFGFHVRGVKTEAMVPFADLLDHANDPGTSWTFDDERDSFVVTATRDLNAGTEVRDSYGAKSNARFLVSYGFCLEQNPEDEAAIRFPAPRSEPTRALLRRWLPGLRLDDEIVFVARALDPHEETRRMFTFLRIACADEVERRMIARFPRGVALAPIGTRNERAVRATLARAAGQALACLEPLDGLPPSLNARNCLLLRRGEERVLRAFAALGEEVTARRAA